MLAKYQNAQAEVTMVKRKLAETEALLLQSKSENQQLKVGREVGAVLGGMFAVLS